MTRKYKIMKMVKNCIDSKKLFSICVICSLVILGKIEKKKNFKGKG